MIYKRCQELKMNKNVDVNGVVVTAFYDQLVEGQL